MDMTARDELYYIIFIIFSLFGSDLSASQFLIAMAITNKLLVAFALACVAVVVADAAPWIQGVGKYVDDDFTFQYTRFKKESHRS
jgi:hypothetical protein